MGGQDIFKAFQELPFRRMTDVQRQRVNDAVQRLDDYRRMAGSGALAYFDEHPGRRMPYFYSKLFGPIGLQTPRRVGAVGFEGNAPLVDPANFIVPRDTNILTGRDATFYWTGVTTFGYLSWTYSANPGFAAPVTTQGPGDIFDSVFDVDGGANVWQNFGLSFPYTGAPFGAAFTGKPRICFEIELYDRKRGRSLTDGKIVAEVVLGGNFQFKTHAKPLRFDPDTEIEPRVYITEVRMSSALDVDAAFNVANVRAFLNIVFAGYNQLEEDINWTEGGPEWVKQGG